MRPHDAEYDLADQRRTAESWAGTPMDSRASTAVAGRGLRGTGARDHSVHRQRLQKTSGGDRQAPQILRELPQGESSGNEAKTTEAGCRNVGWLLFRGLGLKTK